MIAETLCSRLKKKEDFHATLCDSQPLQILIKVGEGIAKRLEDRIRLIEDLRQRLHRLAVEKRQAKLATCQTQLSDWSLRWIPHVQGLLLPENSTPENVARALAVLEKVFEHLKDAERLQYRLKRIGENIVSVRASTELTNESFATTEADWPKR